MNTKAILATGIVALVAVSASIMMTGCSKKPEGSASAARKFTLGLDDAFPPMGFRDENNEIVGYDIDLAKEACSRLGWTFEAKPIDWNAKEMELSTKAIDCIWNGFTMTDERKKSILFAGPYLRNAQVVVVKADSPVRELADLAGKRVEAQAGSSAMEAIDGAAEFKASLAGVVGVKENLTALMDLEAGGTDAVVMDLLVANDNIRRSGKPFRILDESLAPEEYGIGFRMDDTATRDAIWRTLGEMAADGTVSRLAEKWFGADISVIGK